MIHKKHRLMIQRLVRVAGEEFEKLAEEICRDTATIAISTATEYIMLLRREVILRMEMKLVRRDRLGTPKTVSQARAPFKLLGAPVFKGARFC